MLYWIASAWLPRWSQPSFKLVNAAITIISYPLLAKLDVQFAKINVCVCACVCVCQTMNATCTLHGNKQAEPENLLAPYLRLWNIQLYKWCVHQTSGWIANNVQGNRTRVRTLLSGIVVVRLITIQPWPSINDHQCKPIFLKWYTYVYLYVYIYICIYVYIYIY